ncbi:hypothetical protein CHLRE_10g425550v5 [Chlamydomonas reinhardtii]|uniref:Rab proteins geranylgeranyltransferase component A n=1 Tax=Chlamydomonas reinhardtii TaxID=3055 RepID=A0A2K3D9H1_CHLRE|nr:uncharacterized protein CHLRE_10g425550v5 [Chlamydomonas reinhardtii]PNW77176.1 hypothetical protein CHLRE_10g425550v5 [Chlamydomonas reinhardtii]
MAWRITPNHYDVVVIGSGLPECLVAGSLVKSGKSVLIIDAVDTYGTDFASFTPAALQDVIQSQQQHAAQPGEVGEAGSNTSQHPAPASRQLQQPEHEHSMPDALVAPAPLPPGCRLLRLRQRPLPVTGGVRAMAVPGEEGGGPADRRSYILDLVPKLVYQGEALVDLLVRCRGHHYLEFKAVEGGYLLQDGGLQPVPAGRADIFRDRRLGLGDKRALMRFISGCVEARAGQGHLQAALSSSSTPLAAVLADQDLPPRLRELILYGIAMAHTDQEPTSSSSSSIAPEGAQEEEREKQEAATAGAAASAPAPSAPPALALTHAAPPAPAPLAPPATAPAAQQLLSGAAGAAALELLTRSQGRFGHEGAFMVPSYGCGSVAEGFVRLAAVHGAVTVLRQPVQALVLGGRGAAGRRLAAALEREEREREREREEKEGTREKEGGGSQEQPSKTEQVVEQAEEEEREEEEAAGEEEEACLGIVTAAGQVVRCGRLVAGEGTLRCLEGASGRSGPQPPPAQAAVSRAVAVLDGPLLPAAAPTAVAAAAGATAGATASAQPQPQPQSLVCVVVPPRSGGVGGAAIGNPHPVQGLQMGASTHVCPQGRYLLYLSTPASPGSGSGPGSGSAHADLWRALAALADVSGLTDLGTEPPSTQGAGGAAAAVATRAAAEAALPEGAAEVGPRRPRVLRAWFFRQPVTSYQQEQEQAAASTGSGAAALGAGGLPGAVVSVPGPDGSLAGYTHVLQATERVFRSAFPDATWLADMDFSKQRRQEQEQGEGGDGGEGQEGEEGAAGGGGGVEEEEDEDADAIDDLQAALARLKQAEA